MIIKERSILRL